MTVRAKVKDIEGDGVAVARGVKIRVFGEKSYAPGSGAVKVEEVVRLETVGVAEGITPRAVSEPLERKEETLRPARRGLGNRGATLVMGGVVVLLSLVAVGAVLMKEKEADPWGGDLANLAADRTEADGTAIGDLALRAGEYAEQGKAILTKLVAAEAFDEVADLFRSGEGEGSWKPEAMSEVEIEGLKPMIGGEDRPWLLLQGRNADLEQVVYYFVVEDGKLRMDLGATLGLGEWPFEELDGLGAGEVVEMRLMISPANFYTSVPPEEEFQSYRLVVREGDRAIWGYVRRGSPAHEVLARELKENSAIFTSEERMAAIVRLGREDSEGLGWFEITEVLHKHWVKP